MTEQLNLLVYLKYIDKETAKKIFNSLNWYNNSLQYAIDAASIEHLQQSVGYRMVKYYNEMIMKLDELARMNTEFSLN
jgi:hypothetical protein